MNDQESDSKTFDVMKINRSAVTRARRKRTRALIGGGVLIGIGLARRSVLGLVAAAYGIELLVEALTERPLSGHVRKAWKRLGEPTAGFGNGTRDRVDEASWESFPASDPSGAP